VKRLLSTKTSKMRGVSEAVAIVVAFTIVSIIVLYVFLSSQYSLVERIELENPSLLGENLILFLIREAEGLVLSVKNIGSVLVKVDYVIAIKEEGVARYIVNTESNSICNVSSKLIAPGEVIRIMCIGGYVPVGVVSHSGKAYALDPEYYALLIERDVGLPTIPIYAGTMITSTSDLLSFLESPEVFQENAINTSAKLVLINTPSKPPIEINATINMTLALIGVNPSSGLNILLIGWGNGTQSLMQLRDSDNSSAEIKLNQTGTYRFRVKIEGFTGYINLSIGIYSCYINADQMCTVNISGVAQRVTLYTANNVTTGSVGLDPYIFVGDLDGNGNVETVLVTEDFTVGSSTTINDKYAPQSIPIVDTTINPVRLVFTNVPINSNYYSMAVLSLRLFFWDNSLDDITDNYNRVLLRVGLYDPVAKSYSYIVSLSYYELCRYRHVKPLVLSYVTKDFLVVIPSTGKTYYIALEIEDPYYYVDNINDADVIIGIEYVGILLSRR